MLTFISGEPEKYQIPAAAIEKMEELLLKRQVRIHGYMLLKGKEILAEKYFAPYQKNDLHRMYSITKSMVALAVGLLEKNGLITLDDKICTHFPEKLPEGGAHPWCEEMTIRDMLTMRTCYASTTYKNYDWDDWTETFFKAEPDHIPGTVFNYDTSSAHVLCALVEKLTGMKMLDYMRQEMLDELGFSKEAYIIPDPVGVSQGGSGVMCTLEDVARVAYLCNHYGLVDGKEFLPEQFMREATFNLVPTDMQPKLDEQCGYGYFIWRSREEGFELFGMGGQLALCFPQYDVCFMTMADTIGSPAGLQILHDCFYDMIYPYIENLAEENSGRENTDEENESSDIASTADTTEDAPDTVMVSAIAGGMMNFAAKVMTHANTQGHTYQFYPNTMGWKEVAFDWNQGTMRFCIPAGEFTLVFSEKEWKQQKFLNTKYNCECRGIWKLGHFILECFIVDEEQGNVRMDFAWKDSRLSVHIVSTNEPFFIALRKSFQGFASAKAAD